MIGCNFCLPVVDVVENAYAHAGEALRRVKRIEVLDTVDTVYQRAHCAAEGRVCLANHHVLKTIEESLGDIKPR